MASDSAILVHLHLKVVPNAPRSEVMGWVGGALKIKLKAPPVDGKANAELVRFLAGWLEVPRSAVTLVSGANSRSKQVRVVGRDEAAVRRRMETVAELAWENSTGEVWPSR